MCGDDMKCPYINPTAKQCVSCPLPDCVNDEITVEEMRLSEKIDKQADIELSSDPRIRWAQLNPERNRKNKHRHYTENKEKYLSNNKKYYEEHREELKAKAKERYQRNKEYRTQWQKEYLARKKAERVS